MHLEIFNGYSWKHISNQFHLCNRGKGFIEINTLNLCKSLNHQTSLMFWHKVIGIIFDLEDPFTIQWFIIRWKRNKYPSFIDLWRLKLRIHGFFLMLWIFTIQSLNKRMRLININKKKMKHLHLLQPLLNFLHLLKNLSILHL
jgi:hypothetical protein